MSTTTTALSSTPTTCTGASVYEIPITDAACAAPASKNNAADAFDQCCKSASIEKYDHDCGLYCLAQGQTIGDLVDCLTSSGLKDGDVFCTQGNNASASATTSATKTSETGSSTSTSTSTSTKSGDDASETSEGAAVVNQPVSLGGLGLLAMMLCSAVLGVVA